jgi:hypothetical protein
MVFGRDASAQAARRAPVRCDRVATTSFEFGRTGGNLRGTSIRIGPDGAISRRLTGGAWVPADSAIPRDAVTGLARVAWTNGFTGLPTAPSRPTRNPDIARDYIDVRSGCGTKHVESAPGEGAPLFRELLALLTLVAR